MPKSKVIFRVAALLLACFFISAGASAQTQTKTKNEASYEVVVQVLSATNGASDKAANIPQALSGVVKKLRNDYGFSNYRLSETYFQRVADTGNAKSNGISNQTEQNVYAPVFSEWAIDLFQILPDAAGRDSISIGNFRFGRRVPVKTALTNTGEKPDAVAAVNYEQIGFAARKLNLSLGAPTIVGTLSTAKSDELSFLILTVKAAD